MKKMPKYMIYVVYYNEYTHSYHDELYRYDDNPDSAINALACTKNRIRYWYGREDGAYYSNIKVTVYTNGMQYDGSEFLAYIKLHPEL